MSGHTKGPWRAIGWTRREDGAEGLLVAHGAAPDRDEPAGYLCTIIPDEATEADANVMLAAPDLLEALEGMCDAYALLCEDTGKRYHDSPSSKYAVARAAITRARTGEGG